MPVTLEEVQKHCFTYSDRQEVASAQARQPHLQGQRPVDCTERAPDVPLRQGQTRMAHSIYKEINPHREREHFAKLLTNGNSDVGVPGPDRVL